MDLYQQFRREMVLVKMGQGQKTRDLTFQAKTHSYTCR